MEGSDGIPQDHITAWGAIALPVTAGLQEVQGAV